MAENQSGRPRNQIAPSSNSGLPEFHELAQEAKAVEREALPTVRRQLDYSDDGGNYGGHEEEFSQISYFEMQVQARQIEDATGGAVRGHVQMPILSVQKNQSEQSPDEKVLRQFTNEQEGGQLKSYGQGQPPAGMGGEKKQPGFELRIPSIPMLGKKPPQQQTNQAPQALQTPQTPKMPPAQAPQAQYPASDSSISQLSSRLQPKIPRQQPPVAQTNAAGQQAAQEFPSQADSGQQQPALSFKITPDAVARPSDSKVSPPPLPLSQKQNYQQEPSESAGFQDSGADTGSEPLPSTRLPKYGPPGPATPQRMPVSRVQQPSDAPIIQPSYAPEEKDEGGGGDAEPKPESAARRLIEKFRSMPDISRKVASIGEEQGGPLIHPDAFEPHKGGEENDMEKVRRPISGVSSDDEDGQGKTQAAYESEVGQAADERGAGGEPPEDEMPLETAQPAKKIKKGKNSAKGARLPPLPKSSAKPVKNSKSLSMKKGGKGSAELPDMPARSLEIPKHDDVPGMGKKPQKKGKAKVAGMPDGAFAAKIENEKAPIEKGAKSSSLGKKANDATSKQAKSPPGKKTAKPASAQDSTNAKSEPDGARFVATSAPQMQKNQPGRNLPDLTRARGGEKGSVPFGKEGKSESPGVPSEPHISNAGARVLVEREKQSYPQPPGGKRLFPSKSAVSHSAGDEQGVAGEEPQAPSYVQEQIAAIKMGTRVFPGRKPQQAQPQGDESLPAPMLASQERQKEKSISESDLASPVKESEKIADEEEHGPSDDDSGDGAGAQPQPRPSGISRLKSQLPKPPGAAEEPPSQQITAELSVPSIKSKVSGVSAPMLGIGAQQDSNIEQKTEGASVIADEIYFAYARERLRWLYDIYKMGGITLDEFRAQVREKMEGSSASRNGESQEEGGKKKDNAAFQNLNKEAEKKFKK